MLYFRSIRVLITAYQLHTSSFDLWEEVYSASFFTTAVQHRALREGAALASKIQKTPSISNYDTAAANLLCFLQVRSAETMTLTKKV